MRDRLKRFLARAGGESATLEDQGEIARLAAESGDFRRALAYLANALGTDPGREPWLSLLEQIVGRVGVRAEALVPQDGTSSGNSAILAYIWAYTGKPTKALDLLVQLTMAQPDIPYVIWLPRWRSAPGFLEGVPADLGLTVGRGVLHRFPHSELESADARVLLRQVLPLLALATERNPSDAQGWLFYAMFLRKLHEDVDALRTAEAGHACVRSWETAIAKAYALRSLGRFTDVIAAFEEAIRLQPNDISAHSDLGDLYTGASMIEEGLRHYEVVLAKEPNHGWAAAPYYYYKHLLAPADGWDEKLQAFVVRTKNNRGDAYLIDLFGGNIPFVHTFPPAEESIIATATKILMNDEPGSEFAVATSQVESPSAWLAVRQAFAMRGIAVHFDVTVQTYGSPDLRSPIRPVDYAVWRYEGAVAQPIMPVPSAAVTAAIAGLAASRFSLPEWRLQSRLVADSLSLANLDDLLGVLVYPPAPEIDMVVWDWVQRVQVAALLVLAHMDQGWRHSMRRRVLLDLTLGPMDWVGKAAVVVLSDLALRIADAREEVEATFVELIQAVPSDIVWALEPALFFSLLRTKPHRVELRTWMHEHAKHYVRS